MHVKGRVRAQVGDAAEYSLHGSNSTGKMHDASDNWQDEADCTERVPLLFT